MKKNVVVEGCILVADSGAGTITISSAASSNSKIDGKGIYAGDITISISNFSGPGFTGGSGSGTLSGSAQFVSVDGKHVVLEGDQSESISVGATITPQPISPPYTVTILTVVTITSAGQISVQAE